MHWRRAELLHFGHAIVWLEAANAKAAYELAREFDSRDHLGLNRSSVTQVERVEFGEDIAYGKKWLHGRAPVNEWLVVVFGEQDGFRCTSEFFRENWQDVFVPSRDDALVYSEQSPFVLFYCHENELEVGQRAA